jgi:hypothetical protein
MIRYALRCEHGHAFEAWFGSSVAYDTLEAAGEVVCPACGSVSVAKAPMAPAVTRRKREASSLAPDEKQMLALMRDIRAHVEANADNVGERFPEEARKMHHEEIPARSIYGKATREEAEELREEGIPVAPLPRLPEDHN